MRRQALLISSVMITVVALSSLIHEAAAQSQQGAQPSQSQQGAQQVQPEDGMMMGRGMMGGGMMGGGMAGRHEGRGVGGGIMMRMMFSLMDADGDGSISLQEFQAAHERIFRAIDQNKDGRLTMEEMQTFMGGGLGR